MRRYSLPAETRAELADGIRFLSVLNEYDTVSSADDLYDINLSVTGSMTQLAAVSYTDDDLERGAQNLAFYFNSNPDERDAFLRDNDKCIESTRAFWQWAAEDQNRPLLLMTSRLLIWQSLIDLIRAKRSLFMLFARIVLPTETNEIIQCALHDMRREFRCTAIYLRTLMKPIKSGPRDVSQAFRPPTQDLPEFFDKLQGQVTVNIFQAPPQTEEQLRQAQTDQQVSPMYRLFIKYQTIWTALAMDIVLTAIRAQFDPTAVMSSNTAAAVAVFSGLSRAIAGLSGKATESGFVFLSYLTGKEYSMDAKLDIKDAVMYPATFAADVSKQALFDAIEANIDGVAVTVERVVGGACSFLVGALTLDTDKMMAGGVMWLVLVAGFYQFGGPLRQVGSFLMAPQLRLASLVYQSIVNTVRKNRASIRLTTLGEAESALLIEPAPDNGKEKVSDTEEESDLESGDAEEIARQLREIASI